MLFDQTRSEGRWARFLLVMGLGALWIPSVSPSGPRLAIPEVRADGPLHLSISSDDATPLTPARAARITLLRSPRLAPGAVPWTVVDGLRTLSEGVLRMEIPPAGETNSPWFFIAHEKLLPPAVIVNNATGLRAAVAAAKPGTRIHLRPGIYPGGFFFNNLRGQEGLPIVIAADDPQNPPVIAGGANGIQLSDPEWLELADLVFTGANGNGLNIDDGGSFNSPARQIVLRHLRIADVGPQGNRDGIKLSGVVDFRVEGCTIERWGTGGSGIDMVGCHRGVIESNLFRHTAAASSGGANGVQTKGGSRNVIIRRNRFEYAGARGVNVGGSTGLEFFRPALTAGAEHWEAKEIRVEGNTFLGCTAPVAFVGADAAVVRFNTIYRPERWAIRILQENTSAGFVPCRNGQFTDNIVAFHSSQWSAGGVNVGGNTAPATFQFARNWWYCIDDPTRSRPSLPATETAGVYGQSPQFIDAATGDLRLHSESPARGVGAEALPE